MKLVLPLLLAAGLLGGCTSFEDLMDGGNPFAKETRLPGERRALFENAGGLASEDSSPVSIARETPFASWGQAGGTLSNNPPHTPYGGRGARIWSVNAAIKGGKSDERAGARPVSVGGRVAVYSPDGKVSVHSASNGGTIWSTSVRPENEKGVALGGAVAMDGSRVLAATGFSQLVALEAGSGRRLWTFQLDAPARGAPVIVGNMALAVTASNSVFAVNLSDGSEKWVFNGIPEGAGVLASASPAVSGKSVIFAGTSGEVVALGLDDGEMRWSDTIVQGSRRFAVSGISAIAGGPVVNNGVAYVVSVGGNMAALSVKSGERIWDRSIGSIHAPVVSGNSVFVIDLDDRVMALNAKTGKIRWSNQLPSVREKRKRTSWAGPVLAGGSLWFASSDGRLAAVNPKTGQSRVVASGGDPVYIAPIAVGGRLITLSGSGRLSGFN